MNETNRTRAAVTAYVDRTEQRDWTGLNELLAEDMVYEMPQTRERIRGRSAFIQFNRQYPGDWHLTPHRIVADGDRAAIWIDAKVGSESMAACVWFELTGDGLISRVTDFWPESYEPPAGREQLVERW